METYHMEFSTLIDNVLPNDNYHLSINGPFIDAHFGQINKSAPVGQTYFLRPLSHYNSSTKSLEINVNCSNYTTYFNKNKITEDVSFCGKVMISDVELGNRGKDVVYVPSRGSVINVNMTCYSKIGLPLRGLHIHDGKVHNNMTGFGPIAYFLYNTKYWNKQKTIMPFPLPLSNVIPQTDYVLQHSLGKK